MFAPRFFSPVYFTPRYFPPDAESGALHGRPLRPEEERELARARRHRSMIENTFGEVPVKATSGAQTEPFPASVAEPETITHDTTSLIEMSREFGLEAEMASAILEDDEEMVLILMAACI